MPNYIPPAGSGGGGGTPDDNSVTSAKIVDGAIVNADINASAAIALSKLATDPLARANHTGTQAMATISDAGSLATKSTVASADITDGTIVSGDLSATAGITSGQLAGSIAASKITGTAVTAADTGTVTSTMILDGTIAIADMAQAASERAFIIGKAGVIGATETDGSDFFFIAPFNGTFLRMKSVVKTAVSGAMAVQLRAATAPTNSITWGNVSGFVTTFTGTGYFVATVDPANVNFGEGDLIGFSASTGSGSDLLVEVVVVPR